MNIFSKQVWVIANAWNRRPFASAFAALAFALGIGIGVLVWSFYIDTQRYFSSIGNDGNTEDYVVVTKKISVLNAMRPEKSVFSPQELQELATRPFVQGIEPVLANEFDAEAGIELGSIRYRSEIFFESVDDTFLGKTPAAWAWQTPPEGKETIDTVPIMLPRSFLALYNLGFAAARGLPQIPESALSAIPLELRLKGSQGEVRVEARIVGLTDRIDTFLVPKSFMVWANGTLSGKAAIVDSETRRVVVRVDDPANPDLESFLREKLYEVADASKGLREAAYVLNAILTGLMTLAIVLVALALLVFGLKLSLFVHTARSDLATLVLIGFTPGRLAAISTLSFTFPLALAAGLMIWVASVLRSNAAAFLIERGIPVQSGFEWYIGIAVLIVLACLSWIHFGYLRRELEKSVAR